MSLYGWEVTMTEIYLTMKTYCNGVNSWDTVMGVYAEKQAADDACEYMNNLWTTQVVDGSLGVDLYYYVETHQVIQ
jgi:hypothetical protein